MSRTVIGGLIAGLLIAACCRFALADDDARRQLPEAMSDYIRSQPKPNPPPDVLRRPFVDYIRQKHPPRGVPFKVPDGMEIPPGPPRDDEGEDDPEDSNAWKFFLTRLDTSLATFLRQRVQIPEKYLRALAQQPDTKLFPYAGSDSTWWWYHFSHNLPKEETQDGDPKEWIAGASSSPHGSITIHARGCPSLLLPDPVYIIATSSMGMTFGVWRSGHMTITAQFIARHFESTCHTSYWPLGDAQSTISIHTQVSRYDPANIDDTVDHAFNDMQFTHVDLQESIGEPGDVPPGGESPFYSDEFHQPAPGAFVDPPTGATFGPYAYPIVLSPEVCMVEEGQVCSVMIGAVVDVRSNFWQASADGDAFVEFHSLAVTIE